MARPTDGAALDPEEILCLQNKHYRPPDLNLDWLGQKWVRGLGKWN